MRTRRMTPKKAYRLAAGSRLTVVCLLALAATFVWCAVASAGNYVINNCPSAPTPNGDSGPWVIWGSPQLDKGTCGGGPGDWIGPRGGSLSQNASDGVAVYAPSGITIREAKLWWSVPQNSGATGFALIYANGNGVGEANTPYDQKSSPSVLTLPSTTTSLQLVDYCAADDPGHNCEYGSGENANLELYGSQLTLSESIPPKGSMTGGGLSSSNPQSGTQSLSYSAEDTGSGVRMVQLQIDGETVATNDYTADCPYSNFAACPAIESGLISTNTALLADGAHTIQLTVQDAAQNTAYVYTGTITTHNAPSSTSAPVVLAPSQLIVGSSVQAQTGSWSVPAGAGSITYAYQWEDCGSEGNNCYAIPGAQNTSYTPAPGDVGHTLRVVVSAADNDGMNTATSNPTAAVLANSGSLGAPNGPGTGGGGTGGTGGNGGSGSNGASGGSSTSSTSSSSTVSSSGIPGLQVGIGTPNGLVANEVSVLHLGVPSRLSRSYPKRAFKLAGRLTNVGGVPIGGASLEILEMVSGTSRQRLIRHTTTSPAGTFTVAVPAGPSRRIEVAYRAYSGDPTYAATSTVAESVDAGAQLHVSTRYTSSTGTITLSGRVSGPVPSHGTIVDVLVHYRGAWQPIRTPRTNRHGAFKIGYQFHNAHGRFPFRIEIPAGQASFPYATGYSNTVNVTAN